MIILLEAAPKVIKWCLNPSEPAGSYYMIQQEIFTFAPKSEKT